MLSRENSKVAITIFCISCFEVVARALDDVSNNRSKCADVSGSRLSLKITLIEFTYPDQRSKIGALTILSNLHHLMSKCPQISSPSLVNLVRIFFLQVSKLSIFKVPVFNATIRSGCLPYYPPRV